MKKNETEGLNCIKKSVELNSNDSGKLKILACCYLYGKITKVDKLKAKELLSKALEIEPNDEDIKPLWEECV